MKKLQAPVQKLQTVDLKRSGYRSFGKSMKSFAREHLKKGSTSNLARCLTLKFTLDTRQVCQSHERSTWVIASSLASVHYGPTCVGFVSGTVAI